MMSWYDENRKKVGSTNFVSSVRATCKNDSKFEYFVRKIKGKSFDYHLQ